MVHPRSRFLGGFALLWPLSTFLAGILGGCTTNSEPAASGQIHGVSGTLRAEDDDLDAAISRISAQFEIATLESVPLEGDGREYRLVSILDEPVIIRFEPADDGAGAEARPMVVTVSYGRFGDSEKERAIIDALQARLRWLEARD